MTKEREINWAAPVIGKLEVGKTYVDRRGEKHRLTSEAGRLLIDAPAGNGWWESGSVRDDENLRHVLDLIAEYTPPAPLKMWMNVSVYGAKTMYESPGAAEHDAKFTSHINRIAVPVTITEGHEP